MSVTPPGQSWTIHNIGRRILFGKVYPTYRKNGFRRLQLKEKIADGFKEKVDIQSRGGERRPANGYFYQMTNPRGCGSWTDGKRLAMRWDNNGNSADLIVVGRVTNPISFTLDYSADSTLRPLENRVGYALAAPKTLLSLHYIATSPTTESLVLKVFDISGVVDDQNIPASTAIRSITLWTTTAAQGDLLASVSRISSTGQSIAVISSQKTVDTVSETIDTQLNQVDGNVSSQVVVSTAWVIEFDIANGTHNTQVMGEPKTVNSAGSVSGVARARRVESLTRSGSGYNYVYNRGNGYTLTYKDISYSLHLESQNPSANTLSENYQDFAQCVEPTITNGEVVGWGVEGTFKIAESVTMTDTFTSPLVEELYYSSKLGVYLYLEYSGSDTSLGGFPPQYNKYEIKLVKQESLHVLRTRTFTPSALTPMPGSSGIAEFLGLVSRKHHIFVQTDNLIVIAGRPMQDRFFQEYFAFIYNIKTGEHDFRNINPDDIGQSMTNGLAVTQ